jgi:hypothetical protein
MYMCNLSKKTSVLGAVLPLIHMGVGDVFWTPFPGVTEPCSGHVLDVSGRGGKRACPDTPGIPPQNPVSRGGIPPGNGVQSTPNWSR